MLHFEIKTEKLISATFLVQQNLSYNMSFLIFIFIYFYCLPSNLYQICFTHVLSIVIRFMLFLWIKILYITTVKPWLMVIP